MKPPVEEILTEFLQGHHGEKRSKIGCHLVGRISNGCLPLATNNHSKCDENYLSEKLKKAWKASGGVPRRYRSHIVT
jgi:hypothetical protein